jgi:DNA-directed RNA polymerase subunit omega
VRWAARRRPPRSGGDGDHDGGHYNRCSTRKGSDQVISPRIDRLLDNVDSNYASVLVAAKRARQINSYYHNLGEGTFDEFPPPMVETVSKNYLTIALEEVAAGKIKYHYR